MGEKNKTYSKEFKIMVVTDYLSGRSGGTEKSRLYIFEYPAKNLAFKLLLGFGPTPSSCKIIY